MSEQDIEKLYQLVKENNKILKSQQRKEFFAGIIKLIKWGMILFALIWAWGNFIKPTIEFLAQTSAALDKNLGKIEGATGSLNLQNLPIDSATLDKLKQYLPSN